MKRILKDEDFLLHVMKNKVTEMENAYCGRCVLFDDVIWFLNNYFSRVSSMIFEIFGGSWQNWDILRFEFSIGYELGSQGKICGQISVDSVPTPT